MRNLGIATMVFISILVLWAPTMLNAQQIPNYYNITSNMKNGTDNEDPQIMMLGCAGQVGKYDELYEGLKKTDYGKDLKLTEDICHHNFLYYYGICEDVFGPYMWKGNQTKDCSMAKFYIETYKLENQSRPNFYIDPSSVE